MWFGFMLHSSRAALYGNPLLDAAQGGASVLDGLQEAFDNIFYLGRERKQSTEAKTKATLVAERDRSLRLFQALRRHLSKETLSALYKENAPASPEEHLLGGRRQPPYPVPSAE